MIKKQIYIPKVNESAMFKEMAKNIVNPLEFLREGISNSYDADAKKILIVTHRNNPQGRFIVEIHDDGVGMDEKKIHKFFNLGDSNKDSIGIGEKGLGTKTYYKSNCITVYTKTEGGKCLKAIMEKPWIKLKQGKIPPYTLEECEDKIERSGTIVIVEGYLVDNPEKYFNFETIRDYILWFTAGGSFKTLFANYTELHKVIKNMQVAPRITIDDKILNKKEEIAGTHQFYPPQEIPFEDLKEEVYKKSVNYCRHFGPFHRATNIDGEYVSVQIYGTISGVNCRKEICKLKQGENLKSRFGLYLSKDFIPFLKRMQLLQDPFYHHYHILVNSQNFDLTADRNNLSNENDPKVKWIFQQAKDIILNHIKPLGEKGYFKIRKEEEDSYEIESRKINLEKTINNLFNLDNLNIDLIPIIKEPNCESQVLILFVSLLSCNSTKAYIEEISKITIFSSKLSTDLICLDRDNRQVLVEVEYQLSNLFNHKHPIGTFDYVVCWEIDVELNRSIALSSKYNPVLYKEGQKLFLKYNANKIIPVIELKKIVHNILSNENYDRKVVNEEEIVKSN